MICWRASRPPERRRLSKPMSLTKKPMMWSGDRKIYGSGEAIQYMVEGLVSACVTKIVKDGNVWKIQQIQGLGPLIVLAGEYADPDAALAFLEAAGEKGE